MALQRSTGETVKTFSWFAGAVLLLVSLVYLAPIFRITANAAS